jgi:hypothetical protein
VGAHSDAWDEESMLRPVEASRVRAALVDHVAAEQKLLSLKADEVRQH